MVIWIILWDSKKEKVYKYPAYEERVCGRKNVEILLFSNVLFKLAI